ncbi:hypothetical protein CDAR_410451 [Caerostris darwini]|uniref:Uncharacterized protein n=1 Tax=Caerostris darwini TaxID=1538125 RepID=A0AAV4MX40_9ARAC|nr:hypothetical protein CDAR_410451 [Caerostris darwini]
MSTELLEEKEEERKELTPTNLPSESRLNPELDPTSVTDDLTWKHTSLPHTTNTFPPTNFPTFLFCCFRSSSSGRGTERWLKEKQNRRESAVRFQKGPD